MNNLKVGQYRRCVCSNSLVVCLITKVNDFDVLYQFYRPPLGKATGPEWYLPTDQFINEYPLQTDQNGDPIESNLEAVVANGLRRMEDAVERSIKASTLSLVHWDKFLRNTKIDGSNFKFPDFHPRLGVALADYLASRKRSKEEYIKGLTFEYRKNRIIDIRNKWKV